MGRKGGKRIGLDTKACQSLMTGMLHEKPFVEVGFIRKAAGFEGAMKIVVEPHFIDDFAEADFVFLFIDGFKIPFRITHLSEERDLVLKLALINDRKELKPFHQKKLYLLKDQIKHGLEDPEAKDERLGWVGKDMKDVTFGHVGKIVRIDEYPQQWMAVVETANGETLIPLVEDFILGVGESTVTVQLPEGLI